MNWGDKIQQTREKLLELFPVRQIYFRTNGVVRFISIPSWVQMGMLGALTIAMLWVLITSFHFLSRDLVLEEKNETIRNMEVQVDHISDDITILKSNILDRTRQLEERQRYLEALLEQDPIEPLLTPTSSKLEIGPFLPASNSGEEQETAEGQTFDRQSSLIPVEEMESIAQQRFVGIEASQQKVAMAIIARTQDNLSMVDAVLKDTGLNSQDLLANWRENDNQSVGNGGYAVGGPFIATLDIASIEDAGLASDPFRQTAVDLHKQWTDMQNVFEALDSVPSIEPSNSYYISSRFGRRTDPMSKAAAVHYALDMAGVAGSSIIATARGVVTKAKNWGPYGNLVEIDHGNGFKTRYGHLQKINVQEGQIVETGQNIGKMGCTGRCTGTHVHYEVWFGNRPRDPYPFLRVSENVLVTERLSHE